MSETNGKAYAPIPKTMKEMSIEEMKEEYRKRGFEYLGIENGDKPLSVLVSREGKTYRISTTSRYHEWLAAQEALCSLANNVGVLQNRNFLKGLEVEVE